MWGIMRVVKVCMSGSEKIELSFLAQLILNASQLALLAFLIWVRVSFHYFGCSQRSRSQEVVNGTLGI